MYPGSVIGGLIKVEYLCMDTRSVEGEYRASWLIIVFKYVSGLIEIILGLGIVFLGDEMISLYEMMKVKELLEDPHDLVIRMIEAVLPYFLKHREYVVIFLLVLGTTKIIGAIGLTYRKEWGRDMLIVLGIILLPFELVEFFRHPTVLRATYALVNLVIVLYLMNFHPRDYAVGLKGRVGIKGGVREAGQGR